MSFQLKNVYEKPEEFVTVACAAWDVGDLLRIAQVSADITHCCSKEDSYGLISKLLTEETSVRVDENEVPTGVRRDIFEALRRMLITARDKLSCSVDAYNSGKLSDRETILRIEYQVLRYNIAEHSFLKIFGEDAL